MRELDFPCLCHRDNLCIPCLKIRNRLGNIYSKGSKCVEVEDLVYLSRIITAYLSASENDEVRDRSIRLTKELEKLI